MNILSSFLAVLNFSTRQADDDCYHGFSAFKICFKARYDTQPTPFDTAMTG